MFTWCCPHWLWDNPHLFWVSGSGNEGSFPTEFHISPSLLPLLLRACRASWLFLSLSSWSEDWKPQWRWPSLHLSRVSFRWKMKIRAIQLDVFLGICFYWEFSSSYLCSGRINSSADQLRVCQGNVYSPNRYFFSLCSTCSFSLKASGNSNWNGKCHCFCWRFKDF